MTVGGNVKTVMTSVPTADIITLLPSLFTVSKNLKKKKKEAHDFQIIKEKL